MYEEQPAIIDWLFKVIKNKIIVEGPPGVVE